MMGKSKKDSGSFVWEKAARGDTLSRLLPSSNARRIKGQVICRSAFKSSRLRWGRCAGQTSSDELSLFGQRNSETATTFGFGVLERFTAFFVQMACACGIECHVRHLQARV